MKNQKSAPVIQNGNSATTTLAADDDVQTETVSDDSEYESTGFGDEPDYPVIFRDPEDIRLGRRKDGLILLQSLFIVILAGLCFYLYLRKPDLIVAVTSPDGQRVVSINNRDFGQTEAVQLGRDNLTNSDKTYLASEWARLRFGVDLASREKDVEKMLRMLIPRSAVAYARQLKETGVLERERSENWQAVWTQQSVKIDDRDPYTLRIIGTQDITKNIAGAAQKESVQYEVTFKLTSDGTRSNDNFRTGFMVANVGEKEINRNTNQQ